MKILFTLLGILISSKTANAMTFGDQPFTDNKQFAFKNSLFLYTDKDALLQTAQMSTVLIKMKRAEETFGGTGFFYQPDFSKKKLMNLSEQELSSIQSHEYNPQICSSGNSEYLVTSKHVIEGSFKSRVVDLIITLKIWENKEPKEYEAFIQTLELDTKELQNPKVVGRKLKAYMASTANGKATIKQSSTDVEEVLNLFIYGRSASVFSPLDFYKSLIEEGTSFSIGFHLKDLGRGFDNASSEHIFVNFNKLSWKKHHDLDLAILEFTPELKSRIEDLINKKLFYNTITQHKNPTTGQHLLMVGYGDSVYDTVDYLAAVAEGSVRINKYTLNDFASSLGGPGFSGAPLFVEDPYFLTLVGVHISGKVRELPVMTRDINDNKSEVSSMFVEVFNGIGIHIPVEHLNKMLS